MINYTRKVLVHEVDFFMMPLDDVCMVNENILQTLWLNRVRLPFLFLNLAIVLNCFGLLSEGWVDCQYNTRMGWMREQIESRHSIYIRDVTWNLIHTFSLDIIAFSTLSLSSQETVFRNEQWAYGILQQHAVVCMDMYWFPNKRQNYKQEQMQLKIYVSRMFTFLSVDILVYILSLFFILKFAVHLHWRMSVQMYILSTLVFINILLTCVDTIEIITWYGLGHLLENYFIIYNKEFKVLETKIMRGKYDEVPICFITKLSQYLNFTTNLKKTNSSIKWFFVPSECVHAVPTVQK
jgi:hypothetical protein